MKIYPNFLLILWMLIFISGKVYPQPIISIKGELENLKGVKSVEILNCDTFFPEKYLVQVEQPINHKNKNSPTFTQRVWVGFKGKTKPTVFITEGYIGAYAGNPRYVNELCTYLDANMVLVEHRFFAGSTPGPLDWKYHTIEQSANDHHHVNQLMKQVLTGKYISTGISKGGQATMYYKYYFPDDVDVSVPYVGPLNFSIADKRINPFINNINGEVCREKIRNFQILCLERQDKLMPAFNALTEAEGYHYESMGQMWPFFYQALTQIGYYGYDTTGMGQYFDDVHDLTFSFFNITDKKLKFKKKYMKRVDKFLKKNGDNMIYIYGEFDPWSAPA
ncbi:MAG: hypothetical protein B6I19_08555, partial [Bacteroidetes bacterium 4572_114]